MLRVLLGTLAVVCALSRAGADETWAPKDAPIKSRWANDVSPDNVHQEYPRPQMVREKWQNLNGLWDYAITAADQKAAPESYEGKILVPFGVESALSGVMKTVQPDQALWERREFKIPSEWKDSNILLHFGAVDWDATVWVDGTEVGNHKGGYDPFTFDITKALKDGVEKHEIVVRAKDPTQTALQPHGKQTLEPRGIFYTPTTGIWQTVWLEPTPKAYIKSLKLIPKFDGPAKGAAEATAVIDVKVSGAADNHRVRVSLQAMEDLDAPAAGSVEGKAGDALELKIKKPRLWSPDDPYLYGLKIELLDGDNKVDAVDSYIGMRKIALGKDAAGITRIMFNDEFVFQYGFLDQGFWPDGVYTAPTDEAMRYDLEMTKKFGMNLVRKHVKVEPLRWYYHADKLGLIVWQDMPSCRPFIGPEDKDLDRPAEAARQFETEWKNVIDALRNSPAIVMWVPFNEGWGQYDTDRITKLTKEHDPTRLVNSASGWTDRGTGDVNDIHKYPGPESPAPEENRAIVLGEFGGLGLPLEGHIWTPLEKQVWGYRTYKTKEKLAEVYFDLLEQLKPLIDKGLSAAVYTQTTDVESEVNGLMTYDREVVKISIDDLVEAHKKLYQQATKGAKETASR